MIIDPSLAKGLRKRELRRMSDIFNSASSREGKRSRAAWLRRTHALIIGTFGDYVIWVETEGAKPANTIKSYVVIMPIEGDDYIAFLIVFIQIKGKDQSIDIDNLPIAVTHHAFERVIQSVGIANVKKAAKILHSPINAVMAHITKEGLPDEGDKFKCCDPFGMFLFRGDGEGIYLLKTVIKADALEGAKRQEWTAKIGAGGL